MDLFDAVAERDSALFAPLAERMRPRTIDEYVGQDHLMGDGRVLKAMLDNDQVASLVLWGSPGTGKTTLARIIASQSKSHFIFISAIGTGVKEMREALKEAKEMRRYHGKKSILFVDEAHRWNKTQQDELLPHVERGDCYLIAATTENPSFNLNAALLSRCRVLVLKPLTADSLKKVVTGALFDRDRGLGLTGVTITDEALDFIVGHSGGDARIALNSLELAVNIAPAKEIDLRVAEESAQKKALQYDRDGEEHYNVASALIKSIRSSQPDAALYYCARMLSAGEDPLFILRRLVISASEDIGNADPRGLQVAVSGLQAFQMVGMPEGRIILGQVVTYLATAPKSNAAYNGINRAIAEVESSGSLPVPLHIRNGVTGLMRDLGYGAEYRYAHDFEDGAVGMECLPERLAGAEYYVPTRYGYEKYISERLEHVKALREKQE